MKINLKKDWLPVGSIVSVKFDENKYMIIGYTPINNAEKKARDYYAVVYPYGFLSFDRNVVFNREIIEKIYHIGYVDNSFKDLVPVIEQTVMKLKSVDE